MGKLMVRFVAIGLVVALVASCGDDDDGDSAADEAQTTTTELDYEALGLWDDGPCDPASPPLVLGLMTVFESPVVSLGDQALALEAAAAAFNERGGANGSCIEVHTCDDGAKVDQAVACVREIDAAGVVATVNDQGTAGTAEVSAAMATAGIPRVATNVTSDDWDDPNAYPLDPSGTGGTFMHPSSLQGEGVTEVGIVRVDLAEAAALPGLLGDLYEGEVAFPYDVAVPGGTTDFTQFILGAEDAGVGGITISLGEQEAVQVIRAAQQLDSDLLIATGTGTLSHRATAELGDFGEQVVLDNAFPPATYDLPVYEVLRADLAASGEEELQPANMRTSPMRSWIALYALLRMIRDADMTEFGREGITAMLQSATDVPMLGIFGDESWTPDTDHPGLFQRHGIDHYAAYRFDPDATAPEGIEGNFVEVSTTSFADVLCGSPFGGPPPC